jgi:hypothetical protein
MLLVYWLGADLGVLLLARAAKRAALSVAERLFALRMALVIDLTPRICFALMFPVGLQLTRGGGYADIPAWALALAWVLAAGWIALLLVMAARDGSPLAARLNRLHLAFQGVMFLVTAALGVAAMARAGAFPAGWLGLKVLLFGIIFALGIGIDFAFRPVGPAFARLAAQGSQPETEALISSGVDGAVRYVLGLYALLVVSAFLGVTKPF